MSKKIKCNKCKKLLPHTYKFFSFHKPGYLRSTCMSCCRKYAKKKFYEYKKNGMSKKNELLRKSRMEKVKGTFTKQDVEKIRINLRDRCAYCNEPLKGKGHADHIISIFNGGSNFARNITLACRWCNLNKRTKSASAFLQWRIICGLKNREGVINGRQI